MKLNQFISKPVRRGMFSCSHSFSAPQKIALYKFSQKSEVCCFRKHIPRGGLMSWVKKVSTLPLASILQSFAKSAKSAKLTESQLIRLKLRKSHIIVEQEMKKFRYFFLLGKILDAKPFIIIFRHEFLIKNFKFN